MGISFIAEPRRRTMMFASLRSVFIVYMSRNAIFCT